MFGKKVSNESPQAKVDEIPDIAALQGLIRDLNQSIRKAERVLSDLNEATVHAESMLARRPGNSRTTGRW